MIFQAMLICDYKFECYDFEKNGKLSLFKKKLSLSAGTVVDVYGVTSVEASDGIHLFSNFIIYHASLPSFYTIKSHFFRPL